MNNSKHKEHVVFVAGQRTPFGAFGGSLKDLSATDLAVHAATATLKQAGFSGVIHDELGSLIDHVVVGQVVPTGGESAYLPRHVALKIGGPINLPAMLVNRLCGSGFQAWINAYQMIQDGEAESVLAGGVEQMSQIPYLLKGARFGGMRMGNAPLEDLLMSSLTDSYTNSPMAITAENLGEKYNITRKEVDEFSLLSQKRCEKAYQNGIFEKEISPIQLPSKKGDVNFAKDEHPRPDVTLEKLQAMKPLFKKDGLVTAGTASGIVDGAAFSWLMTESKAKNLGLKPLARMIAYASMGCDPKIMGIGPVPAIQKVLKISGMQLSDMNLIEVNEAFAAQFLAVKKELNLDLELTNVNGGAIAIGHPLGASGTRIMNHLVYELHRRPKSQFALGSACIGGGQGIAVIIEKMI